MRMHLRRCTPALALIATLLLAGAGYASPPDLPDSPTLTAEIEMSDFVAGRTLYVGDRVAFRAGDVVPAGAYPSVAVDSLLANGGLKPAPAPPVLELSRDVTELPDDGSGWMRHIPGEGRVLLYGVDLYKAPVRDLVPLIARVEQPVILALLHAAERVHPRYPGGRATILDAVEERRGELAVAGG
jgi:hypothetical protein